MVLVVDFGGQTAHLITRRLKQLGAESKLTLPQNAISEIKKNKPTGIIFSGGPASVYNPGAPTIDPKIFKLGIPILGICYGLQLTAHLLRGEVISGKKEYGPAELTLNDNRLPITQKLPKQFRVWMSHGDEVISMPKDFQILGTSEGVKYAFVESKKRSVYGVQFHPEVEHTEFGVQILENFLKICRSEPFDKTQGKLREESNVRSFANAQDDRQQIIENMKQTVGDSFVIGAVSGGIDSTVTAALTAKAVPNQFFPIYVDNGLMREGNTEWVKKIFKKIGIKPDIVECGEEMLKKLKGISDPEEKRKIIGSFYIEVFERELKRLKQINKDIKFLMQGTIYSDVIESKGTKHADKIKSHHNVGGLPEKMKLKLLEPLRNMYKDEVRVLGEKLGLSKEFVQKQVFPGSGYAVRIRGEVTKERLEKAKQADKIILEELDKAKLLDKVFMSFPILTGASSTAVKGDERFFGEVIALRVIESKDVMTANFTEIPYPILQKIASRIVNEVPRISRVVYDISTKPPATMEWE